MEHIYFIVTIVYLILLRNEVATDDGKGSKESKTNGDDELEERVIQTMDTTTSIIGLLRMKGSNIKGSPPLRSEVEGFANMALAEMMDDEGWYKPLTPIIARMDDPGFLWDSKWYSSAVPTIFVMHDRCVSGRTPSIRKIIKAFTLRWFQFNYNIFVMDTPGFTCASVEFVFRRVSKWGTDYDNAQNLIARFFEIGIEKKKVRPDQINLLGLGLSAHLAGDVARMLNKRIKSVVGVEPYKLKKFPHITTEHAEIVQVYHAMTMNDQSKYKFIREGKTDFYFTVSENLKLYMRSKDTEVCLRRLCFGSFIGMVLKPSRFKAWKCDSHADFLKQTPECSSHEISMQYPPISAPAGIYYLRVTSSFPHGVGEDGNRFDAETMDKNHYDPGDGVTFNSALFAREDLDQLVKSPSTHRVDRKWFNTKQYIPQTPPDYFSTTFTSLELSEEQN